MSDWPTFPPLDEPDEYTDESYAAEQQFCEEYPE